jgi:hypothetical protein
MCVIYLAYHEITLFGILSIYKHIGLELCLYKTIYICYSIFKSVLITNAQWTDGHHTRSVIGFSFANISTVTYSGAQIQLQAKEIYHNFQFHPKWRIKMKK